MTPLTTPSPLDPDITLYAVEFATNTGVGCERCALFVTTVCYRMPCTAIAVERVFGVLNRTVVWMTVDNVIATRLSGGTPKLVCYAEHEPPKRK